MVKPIPSVISRDNARAAGKAVARALRRPSTYPSALREAVMAGINIALYPVGILSDALETDPTASLDGRFSPQLPLRYLDPEAAATPIILLHGYFHNRSAFVVMRRALRRAGFRSVDTLNYQVVGHDVREVAEQLSWRVDDILETTGASKVHLVGHSLGGLVARYFIQEMGGDERVHTCITLGTPHHGTYAALAGWGKAARALRPGSALIEQLESSVRATPVRYVSLYSNLDALVIPASSAKLTEPELRARNILVKDQGHLSLLISRKLIRSVIDTLANPNAPDDAVVTPIRGRASSNGRARRAARGRLAGTQPGGKLDGGSSS